MGLQNSTESCYVLYDVADINPIKLPGIWDSGFALDKHVVRSIYVGDNEFGHPVFDTERSYVGQLVYELKYAQDKKKVGEIVDLAARFIKNIWKIHELVNLIVPIPPSNTYRTFQPVYEISKGIGAALGVKVDLEALSKLDRSQSKNLDDDEKKEILQKSIVLTIKGSEPLNVLVLDDLYDTGSTLTVVTELLKSQKQVRNVYILTMTKTKG